MTPAPSPRSRMLRDVAAVFLAVAGFVAMFWAAAATDWRLVLGLCGVMGMSVGIALARGDE